MRLQTRPVSNLAYCFMTRWQTGNAAIATLASFSLAWRARVDVSSILTRVTNY